MIAPGDVLRNRYRIERSIGRGGMGEVFSAVVLVAAPNKRHDRDATLVSPTVDSARVAVKVVSRAAFTDALMTRLQREATAAARVKSPFVPELLDVSTTDDGEVFLVMELLHGETLAARLKARQCLRWDEVFVLGDDVLSGIIDAHAAGVVHRDLKPSNIFLCEVAPGAAEMVERAKVLDFGVCKIESPGDDQKLTTTGESVGTASYMAPEQIRGASGVNEQADLYSFGTVMFEALSGQLPHAAVGQMAMLASKLERSAMRLKDVAQVPVPDGLDHLIARLLARDPKKRPASALEVRAAWRALGQPVVAPRPSGGVLSGANSPLATQTGMTSGILRAGTPRSQVGLALAAFSVAASVAALVAMLVAPRRDAFSHTEMVAPPTPVEPVSSEAARADPATDPPVTGAPADTAAPAVIAVAPPENADPLPPAPSAKPASHTARWTGVRPASSKQPHIADKPRY